ncbi:hypothetical protein Celaphus_00011939 [Cervus elaphus hippelaphus]|uniref:Uncharacterized protein n=1 Tax=Cervus elaphus hippelaphus TaxID=46360 RepID=A0A212CKX5_CEREH|nr:hypothetical protein Celaphus_00011939 [Cervus elaphus hippelaphus]
MPSTVAPRNEVFNQRELGKCRERSQYNEHSFTSKSILHLLLEIHCFSFRFKYTFIFVKEKANSLQLKSVTMYQAVMTKRHIEQDVVSQITDLGQETLAESPWQCQPCDED